MSDAKVPMADQFAITELISAYSWAFGTGDVDAYVKLFTPDGALIEEVFEEPDIWRGAEQLRQVAEHYRNVPNFPGRQHHVGQSLMVAEGVNVRVKSFLTITECVGEPPYLLRFAGWYDDLVCRDAAGEWRFKERVVRLWDGEVLKNFPGRGERVARKRPPELRIQR
jgi:hypothetical protein